MASKGKKSANLPAVPAGVDKQTRDFLTALKDTVEVMQGKRRNSFMDSVVTFKDLQNMGLKVSQKSGTDADYDFTRFVRSDNPPNPPRDLVVEQQIFANKLTWTNPSDKDLDYIEVWCSVGSDSLSDAERIAIVTKPVAEYKHSGLNTRTSHYYWIRAFNWGGKYSVWEPKQGGYLVTASLDKALEESLHVLQDSITESQLYGDLNSRINLIDGPDFLEGSVNARINVEAIKRGAEIRDERTLRENADSALGSEITTVSAKVEDNTAAIQTEASARADADGALASQVQTVQAKANDNTAAIQIEATARTDADGALAAEYFVKTDANGYIAGFGVHNDGATSEAIFLVDKFAVVTPGQTPKVPFVIAPLNGVSTVGIDGNMVVDGSIAARTLDAEIVTGAFLAASAQISLGLNGLLRLEEGAKLFAGAGNFLLNTSGNKTSLMIGQDGTLDMDGNAAAGKDYMVLTDGDIQFYRWLANEHRMYKALKRWETGFANNGEWVEIPGYWVAPPQIQLSPRNLTCYKDGTHKDQTLNMEVSDLEEFEPSRYKFKANARLVVQAGLLPDFPVGLFDFSILDTLTTKVFTTAEYCSGISVRFRIKAIHPDNISSVYFYQNVRVGLLVGGTERAVVNLSIGANRGFYQGFISISELDSASHNISLKVTRTDAGGTFIEGNPEYETQPKTTPTEVDASTRGDGLIYFDFTNPSAPSGNGWNCISIIYRIEYSGVGRLGFLNDLISVDAFETTSVAVFHKTSFQPWGRFEGHYAGSGWNYHLTIKRVTVETIWQRPKPITASPTMEVYFDSASMTLSGANELASGSVNYIAIGE